MGQPLKDPRAEREAFYRRIAPAHLTPLWEMMSALVPEQPASPCVPTLWSYAEVRPWLMESGNLITAKEAVRRVLILENPGLPGQSAITQFALCRLAADPARRGRAQPPPYPDGLAPDRRGRRRLHRGRGRARHHASGRFHHHAVLDLARSRQSSRRAGGLAGRPRHPAGALPRCRLRGELSAGRAGSRASGRRCMAALRQQPAADRVQVAERDIAGFRLSVCAFAREPAAIWRAWTSRTPAIGHKMEFVNPASGGPAMPTMGAFIQLLPTGFGGKPIAAPTAPCFPSSKATAVP